MVEEIEFGDIVEDIYTGFKGAVVTKTEFVNGCVQWGILGKWDGKSEEPPQSSIDEQSLKIIKKKVKPRKKRESTGGPSSRGIRQRGF